MLVDIHTHFFKYPDHFTEDFRRQSFRSRNKEIDLTVRWDEYHGAAAQCEKTVVFGGKAKLSGLWVPDQDAVSYVGQHPDKLIGFLSVDPLSQILATRQPRWPLRMVKHQIRWKRSTALSILEKLTSVCKTKPSGFWALEHLTIQYFL